MFLFFPTKTSFVMNNKNKITTVTINEHYDSTFKYITSLNLSGRLIKVSNITFKK